MVLFTGGPHNNWGSLASFPKGDREIQEETQGRTKRCEVADESVVVLKFRPVKAGNRLEDKTGTTRNNVYERYYVPKAIIPAKGRSLLEVFWKPTESVR